MERYCSIWRYIKIALAALLVVLFFAMPYIVMEKPRIEDIEPAEIIVDSSFKDDMSLVLHGDGFDNIIAYYINGIWVKDVGTISQDENELKIVLPYKYYHEAGNYNIRIETKLNTEMTAKSNAIKFSVLSDELIDVPVITNVDINSFSNSKELIRPMKILGENINNESRLYINGVFAASELNDGYLEAYLPYSDWCNKSEIEFQIKQFFNGYPTAIESEPYIVKTSVKYFTSDDEEKQTAQNEKIMLDYLSLLLNSNYILIFSVKDESSASMTDSVVNAMKKLGLHENIMSYGMRHSYIGILDAGKNIYERISDEALSYDCEIEGLNISVESKNFNVGDHSSIIINEVEYSRNLQGLNIVVYDKQEKKVVDSVSFNTYQGLALNK